jgi:hypothetical protein
MGGFLVTSLQIEPSNSVILSGTYETDSSQTVSVLCGSHPGGNITFSDGTSLDGTEHTCDGHEGSKSVLSPAKQ